MKMPVKGVFHDNAMLMRFFLPPQVTLEWVSRTIGGIFQSLRLTSAIHLIALKFDVIEKL